MCQEFNTTPTVIMREAAIAPSGLLDAILETRAFTHAHAVVTAKDAPKGMEPPTPVMERLVREIQGEIAAEDIAHG